jgi:hypothetical protein
MRWLSLPRQFAPPAGLEPGREHRVAEGLPDRFSERFALGLLLAFRSVSWADCASFINMQFLHGHMKNCESYL